MSKQLYISRLNGRLHSIYWKKEEIKEEAKFIRDLRSGKIKLDAGETIEEYTADSIQRIKDMVWDLRDYKSDVEYYGECVKNTGDAYAMHCLGA